MPAATEKISWRVLEIVVELARVAYQRQGQQLRIQHQRGLSAILREQRIPRRNRIIRRRRHPLIIGPSAVIGDAARNIRHLPHTRGRGGAVILREGRQSEADRGRNAQHEAERSGGREHVRFSFERHFVMNER